VITLIILMTKILQLITKATTAPTTILPKTGLEMWTSVHYPINRAICGASAIFKTTSAIMLV
jgi:hypothetical protein